MAKGRRRKRRQERRAARQQAKAYAALATEQLAMEGVIDDQTSRRKLRKEVQARAIKLAEDDGSPILDLIRELLQEIWPILIELIKGWLGGLVGSLALDDEDDDE